MELEDFRKDFLENARAIAESEGDFERAAFVTECSRRLIETEELADFEPCYLDMTGSRNRRLRVDGFSFDDVDDSVSVVVSHYSGGSTAEILTQTDASRYFGMLRAFVEDAMNGKLRTIEESSPGYALAGNLLDRKPSITRIRAFLVTDSLLSSRVKDWPEDAILGHPVEFHIWDMARFHRVFESKLGKDEVEVDFEEFSHGGILCLEASQAEGDYRAFLCVLPAEILADVYDRFGSRLLEGNVRSFLSTKGKVNKNIRTSILKEPAMFFAYNNGISATATSVRVKRETDGLRLLGATYLQIVNGGQTTASLANARRRDKADLKDIFVQMKLSEISPEKAELVVPQISKCANSQNKVSDADFFSTHPFHIRMEEISRRIWAPATGGAQHETHWFYERARGQFLNEQIRLTQSEKKKFLHQNPREQVISKTDLAKFENSWRGEPHIVSMGAQKNFHVFAQFIGDKWNKSDAEFNEEYFRHAIAKAILFHYTERLVSRQPWYQNAYRANIVAYTIARLAFLIESEVPGKVLDMRGIWARQGVSRAIDRQLVSISKAVFDVIITPAQGFQNVTEWCKKAFCWDRIKEIPVHLEESLARELVGANEERVAMKEALALQKMDSGIEVQSEVVSLGGAYWSELQDWGRKNRLISEKEDKIMGVAARIPHMVPTDRQSLVLLDVKKRLEEEGFGMNTG